MNLLENLKYFNSDKPANESSYLVSIVELDLLHKF